MTDDNKPPMFGPSAVIDLATYEPRSGKSALMAELAGKPKAMAATPFVVSMTDATAALFQMCVEATNNDASKLRKLSDVLHAFLDEQEIAMP